MQEYNHEAFGKKLKELRVAANLTQKELSKITEKMAIKFNQPELKLSQGYISDLEINKGSAISLDKLYSLSCALNVSMDILLCDSLNSEKPHGENKVYEKLLTFNDVKLDNFVKCMDSLYKYKTGHYINNINANRQKIEQGV